MNTGTKAEFVKSLIPAMVAACKEKPSPEELRKIFDTAQQWADAAETLKADPKYPLFIL
ncbi:hypothetical protein V1687_02605 [Pseudomonas putida]|uniref:hypothetical protein n=1 Tax=Pseudomonas putida TaxID=303 RepID=UPI002ED619C4|nr:hypothetical protein V1687_02605 [Pseudomonas putida]